MALGPEIEWEAPNALFEMQGFKVETGIIAGKGETIYGTRSATWRISEFSKLRDLKMQLVSFFCKASSGANAFLVAS